MSDTKQIVERSCHGENAAHLDPTMKDRHTDGHCVPCCDAIRIFGAGITFADEEHIRYMSTR